MTPRGEEDGGSDADAPHIFAGVRFALAGFDAVDGPQYRFELLRGGGTDAGAWDADCTHVIVYKLVYDDPLCVAARKDGRKVVTELWVDDSFDRGELADADRVLYAPVRDSGGIPGSESLHICLTGYQKNWREDIMKMVSLMEANFSKALKANEVTHLICYKFEGEKYELAKQVHINLVNHRWLEDCLKAWEILPIDDYTKSGWEVEIMEAQAKDSEDEIEDAGRSSSSNRRISRSNPITEIRMKSHVDSDIDASIRGPTISTSNVEGATGRHLGTPEQIRKAEDVYKKSVDIRAGSGSAPNTNGVVNSEVRKESSGVSLQNEDTEMGDARQVNKIEVPAHNSEPDKMASHQNLEAGLKEIPVNTITDEYGTSPPKVSTSKVRNAGTKRSRNAGIKAAADLTNNKIEVAASKPSHDKVVSHENVKTQQGEKCSSPNAAGCIPLFPEEILNIKSRNEVGSSSVGPNGKVNDALVVSKAECVNVIPQKHMKENLPSCARADENQGISSQKVPNSIARNSVAKGSRTADPKMVDSPTIDKSETISLKSRLNVVLPPENGEDYPKTLSSNAIADDPETCTADQVPNNRVRKVVAKRKVSAVQKHKSGGAPCKNATVVVSEDKVVSSERGAQSSRNAGMITLDQDLPNTNEDRMKDAVASFCKDPTKDRSKNMQNSKSRSSKRQKTADLVDVSTEHDKENIPVNSNFISQTKYGHNSMSSKSVTKALQNSKHVPDEHSMIKGHYCGKLNVLEPTWFILSGHRLLRKEYKSILRRLKGRVCRDSHHWSFQATHLVATELRRTEKFFAAAAAGRWILKPDYLTASNEAGKFLEEEPFEWHGDGLNSGDTISLDAPRKWRQLRQCTGHGAFYGMRIIIYGECIAPTLDTLKRTIRAGDGTILATSPPYTRFFKSGGVDFAVVSAGMPSVDAWVQEFMRHNIPCISADYLVEYVCKPGHPLTKHVLFNMHDRAEKSLQKLLENQQDVNGTDAGDACSACGSDNRERLMLVCGSKENQAGCGVRVHGDCCNPPVAAAPDSEWLCPKCDEGKSAKKAKKSAKSRVLKLR